MLQDVEAGSSDLSALQRIDQRCCVNQSAACCIDNQDTVLAFTEGFPVQDVIVGLAGRRMERDDIGLSQQLVCRYIGRILFNLLVLIRIISQDTASKA